MGDVTGIAWTDMTFNPWIGCTKVSPGCDHCYAETRAIRFGDGRLWQGERRRTAAANWRKPLAWNRAAETEGIRKRVFCASLADVFDNQVQAEWRADLFDLIRATPWLNWQILTKRPQNIAKMLPADWGHGWPNVWLGTTCENQAEADRRIPHLLRVPAVVRFLSCEPLLEAIDLRYLYQGKTMTDALAGCSVHPVFEQADRMVAINPTYRDNAKIDWVIIGGESGPGARAIDMAWARDLRDQCSIDGVTVFMKQLGGSRDKRHDPAEWPADLRVQQFPHA